MTIRAFRLPLAATLLAGGLALAPGAARAQGSPLAFYTSFPSGSGGSGESGGTALERGRYAVVIDLDQNRLFFKQGELTLWSAPIGTGTGLRLETKDNEWDFSTPNGVFHVKYKEENPVWIAPDWYFVENKLPVPPPNDRKRFFPGGLGAAAVYIDHDLAIHGTDKPELLGQRVSHGCIRLENKYAERLFHNVQIGTEVVIVGGQHAREPEAEEAKPGARKVGATATFNPSKPKPAPKDPVLAGWERMETEDLLAALDDELWQDAETSRWPEVANLLLDRGLQQDDEALGGLLAAAGDLPSAAVEREYATFLADAFVRGRMRALEVLSQLPGTQRRQAAEAVVRASLLLYAGSFDAPSAPWPTHRIPRSVVSPEARRGWNALAAAEAEYREEHR